MMKTVTRLFDLLDDHAANQPEGLFLSSKKYPHTTGQWKHYTFKEVQQLINRTSQLLINLGLTKGNTIAIISANRPEWNFVDLGAQQTGVVDIPMYPTFSAHDYQFILQDAEVQYVFAEDEAIVQKVMAVQQQCTNLKTIISFERTSGAEYFWDLLPPMEALKIETIDAVKSNIEPGHLATIIYTSGTTGNPKGVMLTHENILSNVFSVMQVLPIIHCKKTLSFLPLCHSFERTVFYVYLSFGLHISYAESLETLVDNLKEVKPFCFTTVPRLLEKVYEKIMAKGAELKGLNKKIFRWAIDTGTHFQIGVEQSLGFRMKLAIARRLVFSKWMDALGGQVQYIITGAAAMQPRLITLFTAAGIQIVEGYGLTETSPVLAVNGYEAKDRCIGTVGMPIPGVEISFASDGEILARGPNIMKGYFKRPDLTAEVIQKDGWFHTGDIGEWVNHNGKKFLKITDRKKELFKTAGGKYIAPQAIEMKMKESPYIEQIMVVGDDTKKFISALVVPSFPQIADWAGKVGLPYTNRTELMAHSRVIELIQAEVEKYNRHFGQWEQIKKISLMSEEWSTATGELTPTMKLKRKVIYEKYESQIRAMYLE
ncbi:MAG: long-chain fatty acid--CoA ligase [Cyclobacteriaceae bacterium]